MEKASYFVLTVHSGKLGSKIRHFINNLVITSDKLSLLLKIRCLLNSKYNQGLKGAHQELASKYDGKNFKQNCEWFLLLLYITQWKRFSQLFPLLFYVMEQHATVIIWSISLMFFNKFWIKCLQLYIDISGINEFLSFTEREIVKTGVGIWEL